MCCRQIHVKNSCGFVWCRLRVSKGEISVELLKIWYWKIFSWAVLWHFRYFPCVCNWNYFKTLFFSFFPFNIQSNSIRFLCSALVLINSTYYSGWAQELRLMHDISIEYFTSLYGFLWASDENKHQYHGIYDFFSYWKNKNERWGRGRVRTKIAAKLKQKEEAATLSSKSCLNTFKIDVWYIQLRYEYEYNSCQVGFERWIESFSVSCFNLHVVM